MARKELYCDKCKQKHYVRVCDLCEKEFKHEYPDYRMEFHKSGIFIFGIEVCESCKKELWKSCKQLKKINEEIKND